LLVWHSACVRCTQVKYLYLLKLRPLLVPIGMRLENARRLNYFGVIQRPTNELQAYRQIMIAQAAGHADSRQPAEISNTANRIGKRESNIQICVEFAGSNWQ